MNPFRFRYVSIVPQYAMSAMNPTRKIGGMTVDLPGPGRWISVTAINARSSSAASTSSASSRTSSIVPDRALGWHEAAHGHGHLDPPQSVAADRRRGHLALDVSTERAVAETLVSFRDRRLVRRA